MTHGVQVGQKLGDYQLLQLLGTGGFAEVYLATHQYLQNRVAIKVLTIPLKSKEADKFLREAQVMARLKHPHIVGCSHFGIEQGIPYLVMDYVPGGTLRDRYPDGSIVPLADVVNSVDQIAEALQYAHDQSVIHLDVKPENMLLTASESVLLADFGIARFNYSVSQKLTSLVGTVAYMAPEFLQSHPQAASDQYALAMVAYEWLVGSCAFTGISGQAVALQHLSTPPPSLRDHDTAIPIAVDQVILRALSKRPEERYPSVRSFAQALAQASTIADATIDLRSMPSPTALYKAGLQSRQGKVQQKTPYGSNRGQFVGQTEKATGSPYHHRQMQIQQTMPDQDEEDLDQTEQQKRFRITAFGPQLHHQWIVTLVWTLFLTGIGATTGAITQSWLIALATLAIAGGAGYFLGYRKALDSKTLAISSAVSLVLTLALTLILAQVNYAQPIGSTYHVSFPGNQLIFGLICGSVTALSTVITALLWHKAIYGYRLRKSSRYLPIVHLIGIGVSIFGAGIGMTTGVAAILAITGLGVGWWEPTASMMELGFLLASFLFIGLGASIPIWRTALAEIGKRGQR